MSNTENDTFADNPENLLKGHLYRLSGKKPVPCSFGEYITFMKSAANRIIEQTQVGDLLVSTIFTGIDHAFGAGEKRLFETKVFGLPTISSHAGVLPPGTRRSGNIAGLSPHWKAEEKKSWQRKSANDRNNSCPLSGFSGQPHRLNTQILSFDEAA